MSKILMIAGILLILGKASSYYSHPYNGYTFILPDTGKERSDSRLTPLELPFYEAQQWCKRHVAGSTLATIPNKSIQHDISDFLENAVKIRIDISSNIYFRVNGRWHRNDSWRWINGHQKEDNLTVHERNENSKHFAYAILNGRNFSIVSARPGTLDYFICEYPVNSKQCALLLNGRCYQKTDKVQHWFDARNECLDGGGDLASFETLLDYDIKISLTNLSLNALYLDYWVGLQKNEWRWNDTGSAIKYTNWFEPSQFTYNKQCLCLEQYEWKWIECNCSSPYPFICLLKDIPPTSRTPASNDIGPVIVAVVSCVVVVVVIIITVVVFIIIRKHRDRRVNSSYETSNANTKETTEEFSVYQENQEPNVNQSAANCSTYATIKSAVESNEESQANNIVYAELDLCQ